MTHMPLPKLNLRDFFWLAVVVAMGLGWWVDHQQANIRYDKLRQWLYLDVRGTRHMQREQRAKIDAAIGRER
jgi:hypothetical protein